MGTSYSGKSHIIGTKLIQLLAGLSFVERCMVVSVSEVQTVYYCIHDLCLYCRDVCLLYIPCPYIQSTIDWAQI